MTNLEIILIILLWIIIGFLCAYKEQKLNNYTNIWMDGLSIIVIAISPIYLIGAIINQTLFKPWK